MHSHSGQWHGDRTTLCTRHDREAGLREEPHATAAVLRSTQAAVSDSVFPACVARARRSVLLRFARPAEAPADNATERIAAGAGPPVRAGNVSAATAEDHDVPI